MQLRPMLKLPDRATLAYVPDGSAGTAATLEAMVKLTRASKILPEIRNLAAEITMPVRAKNVLGELRAVQLWVQRNIRYLKDVRGVETLTPPVYTLALGAGDCDDSSMLTAALLESIGYKTRFVAVGRLPGRYSHVFPEIRVKNRWIAAEVTQPWALGQLPPNMPFRLVRHV